MCCGRVRFDQRVMGAIRVRAYVVRAGCIEAESGFELHQVGCEVRWCMLRIVVV